MPSRCFAARLLCTAWLGLQSTSDRIVWSQYPASRLAAFSKTIPAPRRLMTDNQTVTKM